MHIRPYHDTDLASVAQLFTAAIHRLTTAHYDAAQRAAWAPQPPNLEEWRAHMSGIQTLLAEEQGDLAGFIAYSAKGIIDLAYTAPAYARRGVASALYRQVENALLSQGVTELSTEASLVGRPFFEKQGFWIVEEQLVERRGCTFRRYAMVKSAVSS